MTQFSVVMSTYGGDSAPYLNEAIASVLRQSLPPDELVVVVDGPVGTELEAALGEIAANPCVRIVRSPTNVGQGSARHLGIMQAAHPIVAVMDADDICLPQRFERQIAVLASGQADIVGAWIEEFDEHPGDLGRVRTVPATHEAIYRFGKWRSPMNHVTIMFRKAAYQKAGGYRGWRFFEDYDLFVKMLTRGVRFHNVPEVLVHVRCGRQMFARRGGLEQVGTELRLLRDMHACGYTNLLQFAASVLFRTPTRLMPNSLRRLFYSLVLRQHGDTLRPSSP